MAPHKKGADITSGLLFASQSMTRKNLIYEKKNRTYKLNHVTLVKNVFCQLNKDDWLAKREIIGGEW